MAGRAWKVPSLVLLVMEDIQWWEVLWRQTRPATPDRIQRTEMTMRMVVRLLNSQTNLFIHVGITRELWNQRTGRWTLGRSLNNSTQGRLSNRILSCRDITT